MGLNLNTIMLGSEDSKGLADFYTKVLGAPNPDWSDEANGWFGFKAGDGGLAIGPHSEVKGRNEQPGRIMLNFSTQDLTADFERIKALGAEVVAEPCPVAAAGCKCAPSPTPTATTSNSPRPGIPTRCSREVGNAGRSRLPAHRRFCGERATEGSCGPQWMSLYQHNQLGVHVAPGVKGQWHQPVRSGSYSVRNFSSLASSTRWTTVLASWLSRTHLARVNAEVTAYSRPRARNARIQAVTGR